MFKLIKYNKYFFIQYLQDSISFSSFFSKSLFQKKVQLILYIYVSVIANDKHDEVSSVEVTLADLWNMVKWQQQQQYICGITTFTFALEIRYITEYVHYHYHHNIFEGGVLHKIMFLCLFPVKRVCCMCVQPVFAIYQISIALGLKSIMLISFVKSKSSFFFFRSEVLLLQCLNFVSFPSHTLKQESL